MNYLYHKNAIHISRVDLNVHDMKTSLDFYKNDLGFSVLNSNNDYVSLTLDYETEIIRLYESKQKSSSNPNNLYHFALLLPSRRDLGKFLHHLIRKQIPIDGAADHLVSEAIYLKDPDGFGIEVYCDRDDSAWTYIDNHIEMDNLPFDYKGVYYSINDNDLFVAFPPETIIGHLHLQVTKFEAVADFYQKVIGFNITNKLFPKAIFMSDNQYHHHLAINSWKKTNKNDGEEPRLKSFSITYPSCEKYLYTLKQIKEKNLNHQETNEGIMLSDPEKTSFYIKI